MPVFFFMKKLNCLAVAGEGAAHLFRDLKAVFSEVILLPPHKELPPPVASHPDMLMMSVGDKLFAPEMYVSSNRTIFKQISRLTALKIQPIDIRLETPYPRDIAFNALNTGKHLYSLTEHTAKEIVSEAKLRAIVPRRVKQGYSACSALFIENTVITGDRSISLAASKDGYRVVECDTAGILLPGYDHGFVGGAGGVFGDTVFLFGKNAKLEATLSEFNVVTLSGAPLTDFGGIKIFELSNKT